MLVGKPVHLAAVGAALALLAFGGFVGSGLAQGDGNGEEQPVPEITQDFIDDPANQQVGREIWQEQCRHCHGSSAYPGKAPKLRPSRYDPEFVYHRVAYGYRGMPSWNDIYSEEEIKSVVAFVLGDSFAP